MTALANIRSRKEWAAIINADWRKSIDSIIQTGRDLATAKSELAHGEFSKMIGNDLAFNDGTARKLMRIAAHPEITNRSTSTVLPPSWTVLAELSQLTAEDFRDAAAKGLIKPDISAREARAVAGAYSTPEGGAVGAPGPSNMLPSPSEARKIAQATNRLVAASDGNMYTGASDEEVGDYVSRRRHVFGIREAIERIADCGISPREWVEGAESHWLHDFRPGAIDDTIEWLTAAKEALGVVDA